MKLEPHHQAFLERSARVLGQQLNRRVSQDEILGALLDLAIKDEGLYDPELPTEPLSPSRRVVMQAESTTRSSRLGPDELMAILSGSLPQRSGLSEQDALRLRALRLRGVRVPGEGL